MKKNNLPNNLYELRRRHGLSQEEFAEKLYVSRQAVSKWERGEAYPDTENLIAISDMFGVTIDELLKSENICEAESIKEEGNSEDNDEDNDGFKVNINNKVKLNLSGGIIVDDEDTKVKIDFDNGDIIVDDEDGQVKVGLGNDGITVNDDDGVKIKLGKGHIVIRDDDDDDDDDDEDYSVYNSHKGCVFSLSSAFPYPTVILLAFFILGFSFGAWYWAWTLFLTVPVYYSLISAIRKKRFSSFAYPPFTVFIFLLFGMLFGNWHPGWIIFFTIPIYYPIAAAIDKCNYKKRNH